MNDVTGICYPKRTVSLEEELPCQQVIFQPQAPITSLEVIRGRDLTTDQSFWQISKYP